MKTLVCLAVTAAVLAGPATASAPNLQRQVTTLQTQVRQLTAEVTVLQQQQTSMRQQVAQLQDRATCNQAVGLDITNSVWHTLNLLAQYDGFTPQPDFPRYDDQGACQRLGVTRIR